MAVRLRQINLIHIAVPLRQAITHASHRRDRSDNLIVRVELDDGSVGYGEGVPRIYVTGETIESTFQTLERDDWASKLDELDDLTTVVTRLQQLRLSETEADPRRRFGNAARCGLELAVLDAVTRRLGVPMGQILTAVDAPGIRFRHSTRPVRYSGAITSASARRERIAAWKHRIYRFRHVKVKVGVDGQNDPKRIRDLRQILGRRVDIRLDANEAWPPEQLSEKLEPLLPARPSVLEQPVPDADVGALAELRRGRLGVPIMLDESLCSQQDAESAIAQGTCDFFNIRLSKCGGLIPSLQLIALAQRSGMGVQLGCHPGETGLLSAAGRQLASRVRGIRYLEGSYDRHVLRANLIREDVTFGLGGKALPLTGPGLGVTVDPAKLEALTVTRREVCYD